MTFERNIVVGLLVVLLLAGIACGPKNGDMPVVYVEKDITSDLMVRPGTWEVGEIKRCELASRATPFLSPGEKDLLLCGMPTSLLWLESKPSGEQTVKYPQLVEQGKQARHYLYNHAKTFAVAFHNNGQKEPWIDGKGYDTFWQCKRTGDGISCE
jgi:hypothetical protein